MYQLDRTKFVGLFDDHYTHLAEVAVKKLGLEKLWHYVHEHHTKGLGYHNLNHIRTVTGMAYELAILEGADVYVCVITAMFHDIGHQGRGGPHDADNIQIALNHLTLAYGLPTHPGVQRALIATQYDGHDFPNTPITLEDKVLRDADLCLPFLAPDNARTLMTGLGKELGLWDEHTLYSKGLPDSIDFYAGVRWQTTTAIDRRDECMRRVYALHPI